MSSSSPSTTEPDRVQAKVGASTVIDPLQSLLLGYDYQYICEGPGQWRSTAVIVPLYPESHQEQPKLEEVL